MLVRPPGRGTAQYAREVSFQGLFVRAAIGVTLAVLSLAISSCTSSEADGKVVVVKAREAVRLLGDADLVVLDLRSARAFEAGHVQGARSLPYDEGRFEEQVAGLDTGARYLLYSRDPAVADRAAERMVSLDFSHVVDAGAFGMLALAGADIE